MKLDVFSSRRSALLLAVSLGCVLLAGTGCGSRRSAQYTEEGDMLLHIGKNDEAALAFQRALDADPANGGAKLGQARCFRIANETEKAHAAYREALTLDGSLAEAYAECAQMLLEAGDTAGAQAIAAEYEKADAESGGILLALVLRESGNTAGAITVLEKLRGQFSGSSDVRANLATTYLRAGDAAKAEEEIASILTDLDEGHIVARMMLVEVYRQQGRLPEIVAQLEALVNEHPDDPELKLALARSLVDSGRLDEAEAIAGPILLETPESAWANYVVGCCLLGREAYSDAVDCLQVASRILPKEGLIKDKLALAQRGGKAPDKPALAAPGAVVGAPGGEQVAKDDWRELWRTACFGQLLADREKLLAKGGDNLAETLVLAALFAGNGPALTELLPQLPEASPVKTFVEAMKERKLEAMQEALASWEETDPERMILRENAEAYGYALGGARARATNLLSQCLNQWPHNAVALRNLAQLYSTANLLPFSSRAFQMLTALCPNNLEARSLLLNLYRSANRDEDARQLAEATFAAFPNEPAVHIDLATVYSDQGERDLAIEILNRALLTWPEDVRLKLSLAQVMTLSGQAEKAQALLKAGGFQPEYQWLVDYLGALNAAQLDDWSAVTAYCGAIPKDRRSLSTALLECAAFIKAGQTGEAAKSLMRDDGTTPVLPQKTAALLTALGAAPDGTPESVVALGQAIGKQPQALFDYARGLAFFEGRLQGPAVDTLLGVDKAVPGQPALVLQAMRALVAAVTVEDREALANALAARYPDMPEAYIGLSDLRQADDDEGGRREALRKAESLDPNNVDALLRLAQSHDAANELKEAAALYVRILALAPGRPDIQNNLAYSLLQTGGDPKQALELAEQAAGKMQLDPHVRHTLGLAQLRNGDIPGARASLIMALELRPGDPTLLLDLGQALIAEGNSEDGKRQVASALMYADRLGLDFPRRAEAEQIVKE
jgi:tetratricopeptide (TPR) repeat protein